MNWLKKAIMTIGSYAVKFAGGVAFSTTDADWYARNGYYELYSMLGGGSQSWSGENVSLTSALNHSVVWACNRIISESIGFIPALLVQEARDGDVKEARTHPMYRAMKFAPNDEQSAQSFTETKTSHVVLGGNAYSEIVRRSSTGVAIELRLLLPENVKVDRDNRQRLVYVVKDKNQPDRTFTVEPGKNHEIFHLRGLGWDGIRGYNVITMARQSIGSAIAAEKNVAKFFKGGGRIPYLLQLSKNFKNKEDFDKFRHDWEEVYSDSERVPILEPWLTYEKIGMTMADAQMLESRQFSIPEICRWFSISPHLVGDLSRATFSNIEHLFIQFLQMTLQAWINRWQQDYWRCVLTREEKAAGYQLVHDTFELLRGDFKTRMEGYASALQNGHKNIDEVRKLERLNKLPNGAGTHHHIQLNMQDVEKIGDEVTAGNVPKGIRRIK